MIGKKIYKVFSVFKKHYKVIPLQIFNQDPYKVLVATMLSSRTKDTTTLKAANRLFVHAPDFEKLDNISPKKIKELIYPVGFYNTKALNLKKLALTILKYHKGKVPQNREELIKLPGIGRKTANLVLNNAFGIPAIAVDTHVHRISNLLGLVKTKTPDQTEKELMLKIPKKYWPAINQLFVSIGQQYTNPRKLKEFLQNEDLI